MQQLESSITSKYGIQHSRGTFLTCAGIGSLSRREEREKRSPVFRLHPLYCMIYMHSRADTPHLNERSYICIMLPIRSHINGLTTARTEEVMEANKRKTVAHITSIKPGQPLMHTSFGDLNCLYPGAEPARRCQLQ